MSKFFEKFNENIHIFNELNAVEGYPCGSYLCDGTSYEYSPLMREKQEMLFETIKNNDFEHVLEVGVYRAHSCFIMLLANPDLKITCIDIDDTLSKPTTDILNKHFNNNIKFIHGDSYRILPMLPVKSYDFIHLDGEHTPDRVDFEFENILKLNRNEKYLFIIFDDAECMKDLEMRIRRRYLVLESEIPDCGWWNLRMKIKL